jgi:hypothetical protein
MEKYFVCECGSDSFKWIIHSKVICKKCMNQYWYDVKTHELWLRRYNLEKREYEFNSEKIIE